MLSKNLIISKLKTVEDPELKINIVDLGLIYDIVLDKKNVKVVMTLTSPGCPLSYIFDQLVTSAVKEIKGIESVRVELTFDPLWSPAKMTEEARLELGWVE